MNNEELLNELINGKENVTEFMIEGLSAPLKLRPLTSGEILTLQKIEKKGQKASIKLEKDAKGGSRKFRERVKKEMQRIDSELDYGVLREGMARTKYKAISLSAEVPEEKVERMPNYMVEDIFLKVVEISKITEDDLDLLADFREE